MKARILPILLLLMAGIGCNTAGIIPNRYTSANSGKQLLGRYAPKEQIFTLESRKFKGLSGSSYELQGAITSLIDGDTLEGEIRVHLTEYMNKTEMMSAGVPTWGYRPIGPSPLSSAGAFTISISVDGEPAKPRFLNFFIPSESPVESMEVFYGESTEDSFIWRPIQTGGVPIGGVIFTSESVLGGSGISGYQGFIWLKSYMDQAGIFNINCDYFLPDPMNSSDILVHPVNGTQLNYASLDMSMLIHTENAALSGFWDPTEEAFRFYNVPNGLDVTCFAMSVTTNQQLLLGMIDFETESNGVHSVQLTLSSEEELEDILNNL